VAQRSQRNGLDLLGDWGDIIKPPTREFRLRIPVHQTVYHPPVGLILIVHNKVDEVRADAQGAAKGSMSSVSCRDMRKTIFWQRCPRIADLLLQKAEDPQPCTVPSAALFKVGMICAPACLQGIELHPLPRQRRRCRSYRRWRTIGVSDSAGYPCPKKQRRSFQDAAAGIQPAFFFLLFHNILLS